MSLRHSPSIICAQRRGPDHCTPENREAVTPPGGLESMPLPEQCRTGLDKAKSSSMEWFAGPAASVWSGDVSGAVSGRGAAALRMLASRAPPLKPYILTRASLHTMCVHEQLQVSWTDRCRYSFQPSKTEVDSREGWPHADDHVIAGSARKARCVNPRACKGPCYRRNVFTRWMPGRLWRHGVCKV